MSEPSPAARANAEHHVVGGERRAVVELHALAQFEAPDRGRGLLPAGGQGGRQAQVLPRPTSGSYTLPVTLSCSDSLSECGSMDSASPWLANADGLRICYQTRRIAP